MNGDGTFQAVEYPPEFKRGVKEYLKPKSFLRRGFYPAFEEGYKEQPVPSWEDMISGKADAEIDMPTADPLFGMALTRVKGLKAMRRLIKKDTQAMLKSGKYPKQAVMAGHRVRLAEAKQAAKDVPEMMWGRIEDIVEETGTTAGAHRRRPSVDPAVREVDIGLNPEIFDYKTVIHEILGHEGSAALRKEFARPGAPKAVKRFGSWWSHTSHEMKAMEAALENADLTIEAGRLYKWNPDELYANAVADQMNKGIKLTAAKKAAAKDMYKRRHEIMFNVRRGLESMRELAAAKGVDIDVDFYLKGYYGH